MAALAGTLDSRARELHQHGVELTGRGRPVAGARALRTGLRLLGWSDDGQLPRDDVGQPALVAKLLSSLALTEVELGRAEAGFALLDKAESLVAPQDQGTLAGQRGLLLILTGRMDEALKQLDEAVALLSRAGDRFALAANLLNRGLLHHNAGRIGLARADLMRCQRVAGGLDRPLLLAKAIHNLGHCDLLRGDIPAALRNFEAAAAYYAEAAPGPLVGMVTMDRARALLTAGLVTEAAAEMNVAMPLLARRGASRDRAEAELARGQVALAAGDWQGARLWSRRAQRRFHRQGNDAWAVVSGLLVLQADFRERRGLRRTAGRAERLTAQLRQLGLDADADAATLLAARAYCASGDQDRALAAAHGCRPRTSIANRVQRRLAMAEVCAASGNRGGVMRHSRLGLATLSRHQSRFGSLDLRTGSAVRGVELAAIGLDAALDGSPALAFSWLERSRAQSFRARPVRPPADQQTTYAVAELRHLAQLVRTAELAGDRQVAARRRCAELERIIRARGWQVDGTGDALESVRLGAVVAELTSADSAMASFVVRRGQIFALLITDRGGRLYRLTTWADTAEAVTKLHADLSVLSNVGLPAAISTVVRNSARRQAELLADRLLAPLRRQLGDRDLVVVPTGTLSAVPWGTLPELRGRPVTVAPSAAVWFHARRSHKASSAQTSPLLVAGPHLTHASTEVRAIAKVYTDATVLEGADATVAATLGQIPSHAVVHIAAHGHHEPENVLFSRLDLVDGPLMAYDLEQLDTAPAQVVLPACDVGRPAVRSGDELLGFTAALLYMGSRTVVSCVNRVLDDSAVEIMTAYHRGLTAGHSPARALADACTADAFAPFVCFGSS